PGMNVLPAEIDGRTARIDGLAVDLPAPVAIPAGARAELGVRPEFVRVGRDGFPAAITKIEDIGRHKIVRARIGSREIAAIVAEDGEIPADPHIRFDPRGINIYADSWRVETGGGA
ncbi:MAG TPA: TOBE domain-containing protein, partial [Rhizobiales bacterium]|nr:TOBE domain-containing protein [Hyphomicrobiales bacterium]